MYSGIREYTIVLSDACMMVQGVSNSQYIARYTDEIAKRAENRQNKVVGLNTFLHLTDLVWLARPSHLRPPPPPSFLYEEELCAEN